MKRNYDFPLFTIFLVMAIAACTDDKKAQKQELMPPPYCQNMATTDTSYVKGFLNGQKITGVFNTHAFDADITTAIFICEDEEQKRIGTLFIDLEKGKDQNTFEANIESARFRFDNGCIISSENYIPKDVKCQTDYINLTNEPTCLKGCLNLTLYQPRKTENFPDSVIFKEIQFYKKK